MVGPFQNGRTIRMLEQPDHLSPRNGRTISKWPDHSRIGMVRLIWSDGPFGWSIFGEMVRPLEGFFFVVTTGGIRGGGIVSLICMTLFLLADEHHSLIGKHDCVHIDQDRIANCRAYVRTDPPLVMSEQMLRHLSALLFKSGPLGVPRLCANPVLSRNRQRFRLILHRLQ
jgi:hypothetical protein